MNPTERITETIHRVMLVEDHAEYREAIELVLQAEHDLEMTAWAGSAERAISILKNDKNSADPNVILMDLNLPGISGLEALPQFFAAVPETKIIVLTQSGKEADVLRAIQRGASGYLLKSATVTQIIDAIRTVALGGAILDTSVATYVLDFVKSRNLEDALQSALSQREMQILKLMGEGLVKKEVAIELDISVSTVSTYIRRIYGKLDVQNAPAAIAKAYRVGIFPDDR